MLFLFALFLYKPLCATEQKNLIITLAEQGSVNTIIPLSIVVVENSIPPSANVNVQVKALQTPRNGRVHVVNGFPITDLNFSQAGDYVLEVGVGYTQRSS